MKKIIAFCAPEQKDTEHVVTVKNGEIILTCSLCSSFVKFSSKLSNAEIKNLIDVERTLNSGRATKELHDVNQMKADEERFNAFGD